MASVPHGVWNSASFLALCVSGTPQDCIKAIEDRVEAGVRDFNFGFLSADTAGFYSQMEMFSSQVLPYFRS